jgi:hypothetical protein
VSDRQLREVLGMPFRGSPCRAGEVAGELARTVRERLRRLDPDERRRALDRLMELLAEAPPEA